MNENTCTVGGGARLSIPAFLLGLSLGFCVCIEAAAEDVPAQGETTPDAPAESPPPAANAPEPKPPEPFDPLAYARALPTTAPVVDPSAPTEPDHPPEPAVDAEQTAPTPEPSTDHIRSSIPDRTLRWKAPPARYEVSGSLSGSVFSLVYGAGGELNGNRASIWISPEYFLSPVLDDGTPRSQQPFLQRTGSVWLNVGAGGFETRVPQAPTDRTSTFFYGGAGTDVYLTRVLALMLGGGYRRSTLDDVGTSEVRQTMDVYGGLGFHLGDTRLNLSYSFAASKGQTRWEDLRWGQVHVSWPIVLDRQVAVTPWLTILERGALSGVGLAYWTNKNTAVLLGAFGGSGVLYLENRLVTRYGANAGFRIWVVPSVAVSLSYEPTVDRLGNNLYTQVEHALELTLNVRGP